MEQRPWPATALPVVVLLCLLVARSTALSLQLEPGPGQVVAYAALVALVMVHALVMLRPGRRTSWALAAEAVLVFTPYLIVGAAWGPVAGMLASAALLTLAAPVSWVVFALVIAADAAARALSGAGDPPIVALGLTVVNLNVGLTLYAVGRLTERVRLAGERRRQLAALAVARDRLATARLLHLGIGEDLSAVIRLSRAPGRAQLTDIAERAKRSLAAAREIAGTRRELGLATVRAPDRPAPVMFRFTWWTMLFMVLNHQELVLSNLAEFHRLDVRAWALIGAFLTVTTALQLYHGLPRRDGSAPRAWPWTLALQAALLVPVLLRFGTLAGSAAILVLGTVAVRVRPPWSWPLAALGLAGLAALHSPAGSFAHPYFVAAGVMTVLEIYALHRLPEVTRTLNETGAELARMAVLQERLRVARDVHDLLGAGLSAIRLKAELALRLLTADPCRAREEAHGIGSAAERTLSEVRAITGRPAALTFRDELAATRSLLAAAGIRLSADDRTPPVLPAGTDALLATVLREAATNVVRHSTARTCQVSAQVVDGRVRLRITNDGHAPDTTRPEPATGPATGARFRRGTGLDNLAARAAEGGGHLTAGPDGSLFVLTADLPLTPTARTEVPA
ncbi:hypothetical protein HII36_04635 [Nonomuraea sp. NN258]|uniref:sensor histidine kinase n=1 Tax=Nonomuraea antri TaxID=2730852 RepID=UPI00156A0142|nr:histidine kinase [Nonomuraea antri]NRQ31122.1 hypothetical protein [Nonomuraea antri]